jgi:hypothetical protein
LAASVAWKLNKIKIKIRQHLEHQLLHQSHQLHREAHFNIGMKVLVLLLQFSIK